MKPVRRAQVAWAAFLVSATVQCGGTEVTRPGAETRDSTAPRLVSLTLPPPYSQLYRDSIPVSYTVEDASGVALVVIQREVWADNYSIAADTLRPNGERTVTRSVRLPPPGSTLRAASARVTLYAADIRGNAAVSDTSVSFALPPSVGGTVRPGMTGSPAVPGDTVTIAIGASSKPALTWIGYRIGAPVNLQDSVATSGELARHEFRVVVSRDWIRQGGIGVTGFARNAIDDVGSTLILAEVLDATRRPSTRVPLPGLVRDVAHDAKRGVLYLSQPDSGRILVLSLTTLAFNAPIRIAGAPTGMDLTLGGDSLVVALRRGAAIGILNLVTGAQSRIPVQVDARTGQGPDNLRIASNGRGILTLTHDAAFGATGGVLEYDVQFGTVLPRTDAGPAAASTQSSFITRSEDRSRVLIAIDASCCRTPASMVYDAARDGFVTSDRGGYGPSVSSSARGDRFLLGPLLYDGSMKPIRQVGGPYSGQSTVLSSTGSTAYFGTDYGYLAVRTADDSLVEHVVAGPSGWRLIITPDGERLISVGNTGLLIIQLR
jgi:hypothetical protein